MSSDSSNPANDVFLLLAQGKCTFEQKAESAERIGVAGLAIFNTKNSFYDFSAGLSSSADSNSGDLENERHALKDQVI